MGVGWPKDTSPTENVESLTTAQPTTTKAATDKLAIAKDVDPVIAKYGLGPCNIWIGTTTERTDPAEPQKPKTIPVTVDDGWHLDPEDGIMLIYLPLLPNEKCPNIIPEKTEFMSTWNFQYTPEQVDAVIDLAGRNFQVGEARIRRAVRAMWLRKKMLRLEREREGRVLEKGKALVLSRMEGLREYSRDYRRDIFGGSERED